jgi:hypothetical protein
MAKHFFYLCQVRLECLNRPHRDSMHFHSHQHRLTVVGAGKQTSPGTALLGKMKLIGRIVQASYECNSVLTGRGVEVVGIGQRYFVRSWISCSKKSRSGSRCANRAWNV